MKTLTILFLLCTALMAGPRRHVLFLVSDEIYTYLVC